MEAVEESPTSGRGRRHRVFLRAAVERTPVRTGRLGPALPVFGQIDQGVDRGPGGLARGPPHEVVTGCLGGAGGFACADFHADFQASVTDCPFC